LREAAGMESSGRKERRFGVETDAPTQFRKCTFATAVIAMKILYDHQIFSFQRFGGISRYHVELMKHIGLAGSAEFEFATRYSDNAYIGEIPGIQPNRLPWIGWMGAKSKFLLTFCVNERFSASRVRSGDFDVFHPTYYDPGFLARLGPKPFVLTLHDMIPELYPELFPLDTLYGRFVKSRWITGKKELARRASRILAVSESTRRDAIRLYGIEPRRIEVVHHGATVPASRPVGDRESTSGPPYILFVGGRFGYKNFNRFAKAMRILFDRYHDLQVVCAGGGAFSETETGMLVDLGCADRFVQTDPSDRMLIQIYRNARAFVFPSLYEGFGLPILEAFGNGCPCVISDASSFPEVAATAAVYFNPESVDEMVDSVGRVLGSESLRNSLIQLGFARAGEFSWADAAKRTVQVYREASKASN
jgi:glycosyltransferase involved in cell wall biosynthesis